MRAIDIAAWYGNLSCLKLIMEAGAIIDNISLLGLQNELCDISSLMVASLKGHTTIVKKLLEEGSCISQASPITGWLIMHIFMIHICILKLFVCYYFFYFENNNFENYIIS